MMDYNIRDGRTYMYFKGEPLYPFGYGLSYTTFHYSNLRTSADQLAKDGTITVSVDVTNTGPAPAMPWCSLREASGIEGGAPPRGAERL